VGVSEDPEKLERMRDGREVWVGAEKIADVTTHPAFARGAQTIAGLYDFKRDPSRRDLPTFEEDGDRHTLSWLRPRTHADPTRRLRGMKAIADWSYGLIGRTPDQVASLLAGLATKPSVLENLRQGCGERTFPRG
jgi:4-hydroxyphenylacetate 3-monooxygenase